MTILSEQRGQAKLGVFDWKPKKSWFEIFFFLIALVPRLFLPLTVFCVAFDFSCFWKIYLPS